MERGSAAFVHVGNGGEFVGPIKWIRMLNDVSLAPNLEVDAVPKISNQLFLPLLVPSSWFLEN